MAEQPALDWSIPSDVQYIDGVVAAVRDHCAACDFPPRRVALNVQVALTEALANAILRGNSEQRERVVRIRAIVDAEAVTLEVTDEGEGFDLAESTVDPTTPDRIEREDGRGLFLMQQLADRVEQFTNGGNVVRITVRRK
jgi:serine/threonine-protein kinase RsbW